MKPFASGSTIAMAVLSMWAGLADATAFRTYLSVMGNDANPCSRDQPCRYLPTALAQTEVNGEVTILDSGDYNVSPVTITQAVTVAAAPGVRAVIVADGTDPALGKIGIELFAPAGSQFTFRNLVFLGRGDPASSGTIGIAISTQVPAITLIVEDSEFSDLYFGISLIVNQGKVSVSRSIFQRDNYGLLAIGGQTRQLLQVSIDGCTMAQNIAVGADIISSEASISRSTFTGNHVGAAAGINTNNGTQSQGGEVFLSGNVFSGNDIGVSMCSGCFARSTQDNVFFINGSQVNGTLIPTKTM